MRKTFPIVCLLVSFIGPVQLLPAQHEAFQNISLSRITPEGWQRNFLLKQREGLTGHLDTICEPFSQNVWSGDRSGLKEPFYKRKDGKGREVLCWEPFEQAGYYYDGVLRCGLLLNDTFLLDKAYKQIRSAIAEASPEGVIGHEVPDRWGHVVFFRAFMAAYEATGDRRILDALDRHFTNDKYSLAGCRNIINIEHLIWLYSQTGRRDFLDRSVKLYEAQASRAGDRLVNKFDDLKSDERQDIHGVTFLETLKLPIIRVLSAAVHDVIFRRQSGLISGMTI
jgi:hypothetical protein